MSQRIPLSENLSAVPGLGQVSSEIDLNTGSSMGVSSGSSFRYDATCGLVECTRSGFRGNSSIVGWIHWLEILRGWK